MKRTIVTAALICTNLLLYGCDLFPPVTNSPLTVEVNNDRLWGKYPEPLLVAVAVNPDVNKDVKEITREDLKKIKNYHFLNEYNMEYPDKQYGFADSGEYDFSIILEMPNMTSLDINLGRKIRLKDYSILTKLHNLNSLRIGNITDAEIKYLTGLINLKSLSIWYSKISNINFLQDLPQLTSFELSYVPGIHDFSSLKYLKSIEYINLVNSDITEKDIGTIPDLETLYSLSLYNNNIKNIVSFPKLANLQSLLVSKNPLSSINISPGKLPKIKTLWLTETSLSDLTKLNGIDAIEEIYLWKTQVTRIAPLKRYKNLKYIFANLKNIQDKDELINTGIILSEKN